MFRWWGWAIGACCRSRASLVAKNLCLRQQLLVLRRRAILGPGPIVMVGDNDAGTFGAYTQAGQNYGVPGTRG
jgi:hypothetical protein